jgi:hypothetical protein
MSTTTSDQQITIPVGTDAADAPVAFTNQTSGLESRLVLRYTNEADRTARHAVGIENQVSGLATENRLEVYDGTNWISLYTRSRYAYVRKTANQSVSSASTGTTLINDTALLVALPAAGIFGFALDIFYDGPDAGDIKFAFTAPALATGTYGVHAISTAGAATVGTGQYSATTTFGTAIACGTTGVGTGLLAIIKGEITMGGTAGNLQLQWAQNTADASNTTVRSRSRMEAWRVS